LQIKINRQITDGTVVNHSSIPASKIRLTNHESMIGSGSVDEGNGHLNGHQNKICTFFNWTFFMKIKIIKNTNRSTSKCSQEEHHLLLKEVRAVRSKTASKPPGEDRRWILMTEILCSQMTYPVLNRMVGKQLVCMDAGRN
jgi:hypothetical protein